MKDDDDHKEIEKNPRTFQVRGTVLSSSFILKLRIQIKIFLYERSGRNGEKELLIIFLRHASSVVMSIFIVSKHRRVKKKKKKKNAKRY